MGIIIFLLHDVPAIPCLFPVNFCGTGGSPGLRRRALPRK